jgi:tripartite-type tricarboxylate transporter receptor subunit TctC
MNTGRRTALTGLAATALVGAAPQAWAQEFPTRPVKIIVAFTAGTGSDLLARNIVPELSRALGQSVIVENRAGGGGIVGTEAGARAPADGYTLTVASTGGMLIVPTMMPTAQYRYDKDFVPIGGLARSAYVLVTANTPEAPKTFGEMVERVRKAPGTNFSSPGVGTATHLSGELILKTAGLKTTHVAYKGSAQALSDVASGQVMFGFDTTGATLPLIKGGKLRPLAVSSQNRVPSLPDVPTLSEAGLKGFFVDGWWGLYAPTGTPRDVVAKLSAALGKALSDPEVRKRMAAQEVEPYPLTPAEVTAQLVKEAPLWDQAVKELNLVQK